MMCFLDSTGEALAGLLRAGEHRSQQAADHIAVLEAALAQIPEAHRHGTDLLIRTDSAGGAKAFLTHIRRLRERGIHTFFSVGYPVTEPIRRAICRPSRVVGDLVRAAQAAAGQHPPVVGGLIAVEVVVDG
jgi:hypothetical protein